MQSSRKASTIQYVAIYTYAGEEVPLSDGEQVDLCATAGDTFGWKQFSCYLDFQSEQQAEFERLITEIETNHVRAVLVASLDCLDPLRLARLIAASQQKPNVQDRVSLYVIQEGLDTSTPANTLALRTRATAKYKLRDAQSLPGLQMPPSRVQERGSTSVIQQIYQQIVQRQPCSVEFLMHITRWHRLLVEACVEILLEGGVIETQDIPTISGAAPLIRCVEVKRQKVSIQGNAYPLPLLNVSAQDSREGGPIVFGIEGDPTRYAVERGEQGYTELSALLKEKSGR